MCNKEELSLRATMHLVGPSRQALHVQSSSDDSHMLTTPHRATEAVDDGEALDWNDPEMGKTRQWSRTQRGVGNLTSSGAEVRSGGMAWPSVG